MKHHQLLIRDLNKTFSTESKWQPENIVLAFMNRFSLCILL